MDTSQLRQKVQRLDQQRHSLLQQVLRPLPMIEGSLYEMRRCCGNARCRCTRGDLHASWYLSRRYEKRTKLTYMGKIVPAWIAEGVARYQNYQRSLARIRKIDTEISRILNTLRDEKLRSFEQPQKDRPWS